MELTTRQRDLQSRYLVIKIKEKERIYKISQKITKPLKKEVYTFLKHGRYTDGHKNKYNKQKYVIGIFTKNLSCLQSLITAQTITFHLQRNGPTDGQTKEIMEQNIIFKQLKSQVPFLSKLIQFEILISFHTSCLVPKYSF